MADAPRLHDPGGLQETGCIDRLIGITEGLRTVTVDHHRYQWHREAAADIQVGGIWLGRCVYCGRYAEIVGDVDPRP